MNYWTKSVWCLFLLVLICDQFLSTQAADAPKKTKRWWNKHCSSELPSGRHFENNWDGFFAFHCKKKGQSIASVYSVYRLCKRDRVWSFTCRYNKAAKKNCHWSSHYDNDFDKPLEFRCPNEGFIAGVQSEHNNFHEDRRFKFLCCNSPNYVHYKCTTTHDINDWQKMIDFKVSSQGKRYYLSGAFSYHNNWKEDRRWKFRICHLKFQKGHK